MKNSIRIFLGVRRMLWPDKGVRAAKKVGNPWSNRRVTWVGMIMKLGHLFPLLMLIGVACCFRTQISWRTKSFDQRVFVMDRVLPPYDGEDCTATVTGGGFSFCRYCSFWKITVVGYTCLDVWCEPRLGVAVWKAWKLVPAGVLTCVFLKVLAALIIVLVM